MLKTSSQRKKQDVTRQYFEMLKKSTTRDNGDEMMIKKKKKPNLPSIAYWLQMSICDARQNSSLDFGQQLWKYGFLNRL